MDNIIKFLNQFSKENRFYWLNVLVKQGEVSEALAGYIIRYSKLF